VGKRKEVPVTGVEEKEKICCLSSELAGDGHAVRRKHYKAHVQVKSLGGGGGSANNTWKVKEG